MHSFALLFFHAMRVQYGHGYASNNEKVSANDPVLCRVSVLSAYFQVHVCTVEERWFTHQPIISRAPVVGYLIASPR